MDKSTVTEPQIVPPNLTERRRHILNIVVQEFVHTAQPVGSQTIAKNYDLGVSPATIRNDLAYLEQEGLLTHPHTSAGRVPTDAGYRYFVQYLLTDAELPPEERQAIRVQFRQARQELDQWLNLSTAILARTSQGAALATAPRATKSYYKHLELVGIQDTKVLLVLVLQDGTVKQQLLDLDQAMEQSELSRISNELNDHLVHADATAITEARSNFSPFAKQVATLVAEIIEQLDHQFSEQIYRDGLVQVLEAPEFSGSDHARKIVRVFEQRSLLEQVLGDYSAGSSYRRNEIHVMISGEGRYSDLQDISLVIGRYGILDQATGVVGVIGPLRMPYGRTISAVRYISTLMSEMVEDMYAG
ncbi:MAG: heat-inducible transcription repressor HrcA [Caldilineaceae bacterium]|nr:heat-inducible transcription repressor HrcA [Caldilineaceae bacterium]